MEVFRNKEKKLFASGLQVKKTLYKQFESGSQFVHKSFASGELTRKPMKTLLIMNLFENHLQVTL